MTSLARIIALPLGLAVALAACSHEPDAEPALNQADNQATVELPAPMPVPPVAVINQSNSAIVSEPSPVDQPELDRQTQEDADATGMTARLPANEDTAPANQNEAQK